MRDLTKRELEVLNWMAEGLTTAEMAKMLGIKPTTVTYHLENIYSKLGTNNRVAACRVARKRGILKD